MRAIEAMAALILLAISAVVWYIDRTKTDVKHANDERDKAIRVLQEKQEKERREDQEESAKITTPAGAVDWLRESLTGPGDSHPVSDPGPAPVSKPAVPE